MAGRHLMLLVTAGLLFLGGAIFWGEMNRAAASMALFHWPILGPVLGLSVLNYLLRALRWEYYLRLLAVRLPLLKSLGIFLASLLFVITPGRLGEVAKSYFVNKVDCTVPVSRTVPVVLAERLVDLLATALLAAAGLATFSMGWEILLVCGVIVGGMIALISSRRLMQAVFSRLNRIPRLARAMPHILEMYEGAYTLMRPRPLLISLVLSVPAWFTECLGLYLVLGAFGVHVPLLAATFTYTLATLIGALSMLPGGLGATEGSLAVMLAGVGVDPGVALAATFITRACTLWFAVGLGGLVLLARNREFCGGARIGQVIKQVRT
jgi:uncharacterized protein (TIRG00374 family)